MTKSSILFLFIAFAHFSFIAATAEEQIDTRPRGVPPQLVSFYQESAEFECLDGSKKIPFDQVNDDYCDCGDGSDEPGTAACKNGKFYCSNFGHQSVLIPSNRVNDYICDCCDGSDEWDSGTECPNICEAQGSKAREEAKKQKAIEEIGWGKRVELAKEGQKMLEERKVELEKKKKELEELEAQKGGIEERKKEAENAEEIAKKRQDDLWEEEKKRKERKEAEEFLEKMDTDGDGKIKKEELRKYIGQNDDGGGQNDEEEGGGGKEEEMLKEIFGEEADTLDLEMIIAKLYTIRDLINIKAAKEDGPKEEEGEGEGSEEEKAAEITEPQYDEETRKLIEKADEIRKEFDELGGKIGKMQDEIRECEQFLEFEYGKDQEWAPMKDKCAELMTTQYVYKICLFDKTVQKDRSGYSEINLGYWGAWNGPDEANKFSVQKYDHGQSCWNGPERSTIVELECGIELELIEASEPSKCEYKFVVKAPAACKNPEENKNEHSEL